MTADKTLLRMKYADIVRVLSERTGMPMEAALKRFYESREYRLVSRGVSNLHCMTPDYIVCDILAEGVPEDRGRGKDSAPTTDEAPSRTASRGTSPDLAGAE